MTPRPFWKAILFRVIAVLLSLSPLLAVEGACRLFDWGLPTDYDDPYVGFSEVHPLFMFNKKTGRYEIPESRGKFFNFDAFNAVKPDDEFRIFVLGGSTVQGRPYQKETSFAAWLELSLRAAEPERRWRAVNCGGISYASYRLVPILEEVLNYEPDLIIVCTGHNEFLEERSYEHIKHRSNWFARTQQYAAQLRTFNLLRGAYLHLLSDDDKLADRPILAPEVDAMLDPITGEDRWNKQTMQSGLDQYRRNEDWRQGVLAHFRFNLQRMVDIADGAGVPVIFVCEASNLDWPPFKSEHRDDLTDEERQQFSDLLQKVKDTHDLGKEIHWLEQARDIDDRHALVHYELGKRYLLVAMHREAKESLLRACDEDICPLRMLPAMRDDMLALARQSGTPIVDAHALIEERSIAGIPGDEWMIDHVHPTIEGHQLIAEELLKAMTQRGMVQPAQGWEATRDQAYEKHLQDLPVTYYERGQQRLKGLMRWAYGKARYNTK